MLKAIQFNGIGSMKLSSILLSAALTLTTATAGAAEYFKWVDENGVTHYGENPPKGQTSYRIKTQTGHSEPTVYGKPKKDQQAEAEASKESRKDPTRCAAAKKNLETMRTNSRIRVKDAKTGELRYMTPSEIGERQREAQQIVSESC